VLTSQYDRSLPRVERLDRVRVVRAPVLVRVSKAVIMPTFGFLATRFTRWADVLSIHLPQLDATGIAARGRLFHKPTVLTYHCDLQLPAGILNHLANTIVPAANFAAGALADAIVAYTQDYATHSGFLSRFLDKVRVIPPPVEMPQPAPEAIAAFRKAQSLNGHHVIGFAARLATEKGVEVLLEALPHILPTFPDARVLFAGPTDIIGEEAYARKLAPMFERFRDHWTFLGTLDPKEMAAFFSACDCTVLPSLNSTESFGLVQVEAMLCGTPSVASDLPGVRVPVQTTGMGQVVGVRDSSALAQAVIRVMSDRARYVRPRAEIEAMYSTPRTAELYEKLFEELNADKSREGVRTTLGSSSEETLTVVDR
jgi:glycosyltransferase involved in cell wall biosynthesis